MTSSAQDSYTLYSWQLSYFSGKTRGYLNFKGIPYTDKNINAFDMTYRIPKATGASVMPAIKNNKGEWFQDTTAIVEALEERHPDFPVVPSTPKQLIASLLLEAWLDEWWLPVGMHYRWSYPENRVLFMHEASTGLLPYTPDFIRRRLANKIANKLHSFAPLIGVREGQLAGMESFTNKMLDVFEQHFAQSAFLFGDRPSIADFALLGPLYGHLNRDPAPKRDLLDIRPNLQAWVARCHAGEGRDGQFVENDEVPETLKPLFTSIFTEFFPLLDGIAKNIGDHVAKNHKKSGDKLPRLVGDAASTMDGQAFSRGAVPYTLWMMQRVQNIFNALPDADQDAIKQWLRDYDDRDLMSKDFGPALKRTGVTTCLA